MSLSYTCFQAQRGNLLEVEAHGIKQSEATVIIMSERQYQDLVQSGRHENPGDLARAIATQRVKLTLSESCKRVELPADDTWYALVDTREVDAYRTRVLP